MWGQKDLKPIKKGSKIKERIDAKCLKTVK